MPRLLHAVVLHILLLIPDQCQGEALALTGGKVYVGPDKPPLIRSTVVIAEARIIAVGPDAAINIPTGAKLIDCTGLTVTAGFWNSHVHFSDKQWENAASLPAHRVAAQLQRMLTRSASTTVFDTGSSFTNTQALRSRIEQKEVRGPRILTVGEPFVAENGTPYYLTPLIAGTSLSLRQATQLTRAKLARGADGIKLHAGTIVNSPTGRQHLAIAVEMIRAVAAEAHEHGKPVFAHPQYQAGLESAIDGGVDILAHLTEELERWPGHLLKRAVAKNMALIPTLKLLAGTEPSRKQQNLLRQLREYRQAGGRFSLAPTPAMFRSTIRPTSMP